jgi:hypothetical protein
LRNRIARIGRSRAGARLEALAGSLGDEVAYEAASSSALGYCDERAKRIVVDPNRPANGQVRVLIHECAHALGIGYEEQGRAAAEVIVESAATIACGSIGLGRAIGR